MGAYEVSLLLEGVEGVDDRTTIALYGRRHLGGLEIVGANGWDEYIYDVNG
jgi:hypothetical protein